MGKSSSQRMPWTRLHVMEQDKLLEIHSHAFWIVQCPCNIWETDGNSLGPAMVGDMPLLSQWQPDQDSGPAFGPFVNSFSATQRRKFEAETQEVSLFPEICGHISNSDCHRPRKDTEDYRLPSSARCAWSQKCTRILHLLHEIHPSLQWDCQASHPIDRLESQTESQIECQTRYQNGSRQLQMDARGPTEVRQARQEPWQGVKCCKIQRLSKGPQLDWWRGKSVLTGKSWRRNSSRIQQD